MISNENEVCLITSKHNFSKVKNAQCHCERDLYQCADIFQIKENDIAVRCADDGKHWYWFSKLRCGSQLEHEEEFYKEKQGNE